MAKIFRKTRNPYVLCAVTHSLTLMGQLLYQSLLCLIYATSACWSKVAGTPYIVISVATYTCLTSISKVVKTGY